MKSKLFSRVAAAILGVAMLSTVSFADGPVSYDEAGKASQFTVTLDDFKDANDQMTMMAYTISQDAEEVPAFDPETMNIVAADQVATTEDFGVNGTVSFDKNRIPADKNLAIVLSGSSATTAPLFKAIYTTNDIHLVTVDGGEPFISDEYTHEDGENVTVYKDVKLISCSYDPGATDKAVKKVKISFDDTFKFNDGTDRTFFVEEAFNIEGGAAATFQVCLTGLPAEYFGENSTPINTNISFDVEGNVQ